MACRLQGILETYLDIGTSLPFLDPRESVDASAVQRHCFPRVYRFFGPEIVRPGIFPYPCMSRPRESVETVARCLLPLLQHVVFVLRVLVARTLE